MSRQHVLLILTLSIHGTCDDVSAQRRIVTPRSTLVDRYCGAIAQIAMRAHAQCACGSEGPDTRSEVSAQCEFWLLQGTRLPETGHVIVNEPALTHCLAEMQTRVATCARARVPVSCQPDRIFSLRNAQTPLESIALGLPEGADCRRSNGDEGFNAHYVCAEGLVCDGVCVRPPAAASCTNRAGCAGSDVCVGGICQPSLCAGALELPCACG